MRIVIEICLGLLYVICILVYFRYFCKKNPLKENEGQLNDLKTKKLT